MMRRTFGGHFLLTCFTLVGGAAEPAPQSRPLFPATVTCFMAKIDSGSSCSSTMTKVPEPDPRSRWSSGMTCGWPGQVSELRWEFLGSEGGTDVYQITRRFPADAEKSETVTQTIKYAGKRLIVFADNYHVVVVAPPGPPGSESEKSQQPAWAGPG